MEKALSKDLTAHDFLKTLAIILMVIDHVGYYFFPEQIWFRVLGRLSVPIWFFLIGYAKTRDVQKTIWQGGLVVAAASLIAGEYLLPLNILFTLGLARLMIDTIMRRALKNKEALIGMFFTLSLLALPTMVFFEYGTLGLLFTVFGFLMRYREAIALRFPEVMAYFSASALVYIILQSLFLKTLTLVQFFALCLGMIATGIMLFRFESRTYPDLSERIRPFVPVLQITGRHTLEVYVLHLLIFKALAMFLYPERFGFFDFKIVPHGLISFFL